MSEAKKHLGNSVTLPDNTKITSDKQGIIPLNPAFSKTARTATNLPHLKTALLVAVGPLCDDGKLVIFNNKQVIVVEPTSQLISAIKSSVPLLCGKLNAIDGCWDIPIEKTQLNPNNFTLPPSHGVYIITRNNNRISSPRKYLLLNLHIVHVKYIIMCLILSMPSLMIPY